MNEREKDNSVKINLDGHRTRMRERAERDDGLNTFTDREIIEFILGFFIPRKDTREMAEQLIVNYGSAERVFEAPASMLIKESGITVGAAKCLSLFGDLCAPEIHDVRAVKMSDLLELLAAIAVTRGTEKTSAAMFDENNALSRVVEYAELLPIQDIVGTAVRTGAKSVILFKYAPTLGIEHYDFAAKVKDAAMVLCGARIQLIDFILYTKHGFYGTVMSTVRPGEMCYEYVPYAVAGVSEEFLLNIMEDYIPTLRRKQEYFPFTDGKPLPDPANDDDDKP